MLLRNEHRVPATRWFPAMVMYGSARARWSSHPGPWQTA